LFVRLAARCEATVLPQTFFRLATYTGRSLSILAAQVKLKKNREDAENAEVAQRNPTGTY